MEKTPSSTSLQLTIKRTTKNHEEDHHSARHSRIIAIGRHCLALYQPEQTEGGEQGNGTNLADLDKKEMENEYQQFANQYGEMKTQINNDSIIAQLTQEQERTQKPVAGAAQHQEHGCP